MKKQIKVLAAVCFILVIAALIFALVSDGIIIGKNLVGLAVAMLVSGMVFIFGLILMVVSIMLVFGIVVLQDHGFWPLDWAIRTFHEVMADYPVTTEQLQAMLAIRIVLLVICFAVIIMSSIVIKQIKTAKKEDKDVKVKPARGFAHVSRVMALLGFLVSTGALFILIALLN